MPEDDKLRAPFGIMADCFQAKTVVPFLGAAASFVGANAAGLPSGAELARILASKSDYPGLSSDSLSKVAQFVEEIGDRSYLLGFIADTFGERIPLSYSSAFTRFLASLPETSLPPLIITTNYDTLVERTLAARGIPYLAVSHIMGRETKYFGRFICYDSLTASIKPITKSELEERLHDDEGAIARTIVYKIHGTSKILCDRELLDSVVLTETDYVDFLADEMLKRMPTKVLEILGRSHLLFLGYSLGDWNFRVLLQRLYIMQKRGGRASKRQHWACMLSGDRVEERFWEKRNVTLYPQSLDLFLDQLGSLIDPVVT